MSGLGLTQDGLLEKYGPCFADGRGREACSCPANACPLHGMCCACVTWHREHGKKPLPHCLRALEGVHWEQRQ